MDFNCPRCGATNTAPTNFCRNCGVQFAPVQSGQPFTPKPPKRKTSPLAIVGALLFGIQVLCCALSVSESNKPKIEVSNSNSQQIQNPLPTPAENPVQALADAKKALADNYNEKQKAYGKISVAKPLLQSITSNQKEYKEAQNLL